MIISSAPFRISFAGGGSDLPVFCQRRKGAVLSTTIDKHVYISIHPYFHRRQTLLKYSRNELVDRVEQIEHPIFRTALLDLWPQGGLEIVSTADIPAGTGLGSSSTFTVALLHALHAFRGVFSSKEKLAREACQIEIDRLGEPIGRQDQYAAAYGGLNFMEFLPDGGVVVTPLLLRQEIVTVLERNLLLFYTGQQRDTRGVLTDQQQQVAASEEKFNNLARMADYAYQMRDQLLAGELAAFARSMHEAWLLKRTLSSRIGTTRIDQYYQRAMEYGALGGKLLGAGGGGFLLLYCEADKQERLRNAMFDLDELPVRFDFAGSRIIHVGDSHTATGFVN
jgi:D-glycero-alpha-D-manno-heptose-7-phosphate kinase